MLGHVRSLFFWIAVAAVVAFLAFEAFAPLFLAIRTRNLLWIAGIAAGLWISLRIVAIQWHDEFHPYRDEKPNGEQDDTT